DALFADFAKLTVKATRERYGAGDEAQAVQKAWDQVGVRSL
ncbi:peptidase M4 family protein, partial [Streptomyces sp. SID2955]|nr:peptidase M4 family protein [Streptomyces sp. SID2955]